MSTMLSDLRHGIRVMKKNPGFTTTAVLTLGLTIGISTVVFSVIDAVLLRPLPYDHPDRIYSLHTYSPQSYTQPASYPEYLDWRRDNHVFSALAAYSAYGSANVEGPSGAVALPRVMATDNFFDVFGIAPVLGRTFAPGEDQPGRNDVAVLSYEIWQQNFGGQENAIGQTMKIDAQPYTVIGVMPAGFRFPVSTRDAIYTPMNMAKELAESRGDHWLPTVARLKNGVDKTQAQADMNRVLEDVGRAYPEESKGRRMQLWSLAASINESASQPLKVLSMAVLCLLAIGCVNIAGLLLVRGVKREREIALRAAVGASRGQLVRQILNESLLLGFLGAICGTFLAYGLLEGIRKLLTSAIARGAEVHMDKTVLLVALVLALLTSLLAGMIPALRASLIAPQVALKSGGSAGTGRGQHRLRAGFVITQVALALVLLVTSGLLLRVLSSLRNADLGFNPNGLMATEIDLSSKAYENRDVVAAFYQPMLERVRSVPGVRAAGLVGMLPIQNWGWNSDIHIAGQPPDPPNAERLAEMRPVTPGYFDAFGIALVRGRLLDDKIDTRTSQPVVVVNEAFVKKFFSNGEDPIGKYIEWNNKPMIVGLVRSIRQDIYEPPLAEMDLPVSQVPHLTSMQLVVRTDVTSSSVVPALRRIFHDLDPGLPFRQPITMREVVADALVLDRLENWLFGSFAVLAVLLALVGLYGLVSHEIELSTRDIGLRMALGATRLSVLRSVYRRVAWMLCGGVVAGLLITKAVQKLIETVVAVHGAADALVILGLAGALFVAGLMAALWPARRAISIDPMVALRYE